jgi:acylphosphatase
MLAAKRFLVHGRVQGVGYRAFAQREAARLALTGYARNLPDGRVEVYAAGNPTSLDDFLARLYQGPRWADVRSIETFDAPVLKYEGFRILA